MKYDFTGKQFTDIDHDQHKLALAGSDHDLDWITLMRETERLSSILRELKIPQGHPVLIYGHKESFFAVAILACIHSTIPYIPVDQIYPPDRVREIGRISGSQILINCSKTSPGLHMAVEIDEKGATVHRQPDYTGAVYGSSEDPLQYIMFTSGSTGEPKGVQITRQAVITFLHWVLRDYGFKQSDVFMNQAPFTFDISLYDILGAFALGGTVVLNSADMCKEQELFLKRTIHYKCSIWNSTPSFVFLYLRHAEFKSEKLKSLHTFLLLGEQFPKRTALILKEKFSSARLFNAYGPTEATVATTSIELSAEIIQKYDHLPIGYAMPGSDLFIDSKPGTTEGELIICGEHTSIGYLKRPEQNLLKFFMHNGRRAFRTGDLVTQENGMFFFLGRNDDQVKMNGFRIELDEISAVLSKNAMIADAVSVPLKRNGEVKKIVSFIILKPGVVYEDAKPELISYLEALLPHYMVPGDLANVDAFPYSASHKIDRNALIDRYLAQKMNPGG